MQTTVTVILTVNQTVLHLSLFQYQVHLCTINQTITEMQMLSSRQR